MGADLVGVVGQLDAAGLAAPAHLHLGLDDDGVAGRLGLGDGLVDRVGHAAGRHRDAEAGEVLLALVLEQVHSGLLFFSLVERGFQPLADGRERRARGEHLGDAQILERGDVGGRDHPAAEHEHVVEARERAARP